MKSIWELLEEKHPDDRPEIVMFIKNLFHCHVRMAPNTFIPGVCVCWGDFIEQDGVRSHHEDFHYLFCGPNAKIGGRT